MAVSIAKIVRVLYPNAKERPVLGPDSPVYYLVSVDGDPTPAPRDVEYKVSPIFVD